MLQPNVGGVPSDHIWLSLQYHKLSILVVYQALSSQEQTGSRLRRWVLRNQSLEQPIKVRYFSFNTQSLKILMIHAIMSAGELHTYNDIVNLRH